MKYKLVVNPAAGKGSAIKSIPQIEKFMKQNRVRFEIVQTEKPWHAVELTRKAVQDGFDAVVAVGGDGTINEVINGLMLAKESGEGYALLGVISVGQGNDFAYGVGIPHDLEIDCHLLAKACRKNIDVGRVLVDDSKHHRYFGNGIGIGFDTVVGFEAQKQKVLKGFLSYAVGALKTLFLYFHAPLIRLSYNKKTVTDPYLMVSIMNGQRMGGGFMMAPEGDPADGELDLCLVGQTSRLHILNLIVQFLKGTQKGKRAVTTDRTDRIVVEAVKGVLPAHADGETLCVEGKRLEVEIMPGKLGIICKEPDA